MTGPSETDSKAATSHLFPGDAQRCIPRHLPLICSPRQALDIWQPQPACSSSDESETGLWDLGRAKSPSRLAHSRCTTPCKCHVQLLVQGFSLNGQASRASACRAGPGDQGRQALYPLFRLGLSKTGLLGYRAQDLTHECSHCASLSPIAARAGIISSVGRHHSRLVKAQMWHSCSHLYDAHVCPCIGQHPEHTSQARSFSAPRQRGERPSRDRTRGRELPATRRATARRRPLSLSTSLAASPVTPAASPTCMWPQGSGFSS